MMFAQHLKTSLRSLWSQKFYTVLNVLGFGLGITVFVLVCVYILDQYMYDRGVPDREHIYRMEAGEWALTGTLQGPMMAGQVPGIEGFCRIDLFSMSRPDVFVGEELHRLSQVMMADSTFFDFFPVTFLAGVPETALSDPHSLVLTRTEAMKVFGTTDVVGRMVTHRSVPLQITGVIEDVRYLHLPFSALVPFPLLSELFNRPGMMNEFGSWNYFTFFKLNPHADPEEVEARMNGLIQEYFAEWTGEQFPMTYSLRPLPEVFFHDEVMHEAPIIHGSRSAVNSFLALALFVLAIAVINFMNLATARAATRSKEVGVRKLLGSTRLALVGQFLLESLLVTAMAVLIALILVELFLTDFNQLAGTVFRLGDLGAGPLIALFLGGTVLVGLLSGIYPAFYLTAFQPVSALKGERTRGKRGAFFRKALIVFQFTVSIALVAATVTVYRQIHFMKSQELGFRKENTIILDAPGTSRKEAFKTALQELPGVLEVSFSNAVPGSITWQNSEMVNGIRKQYTFLPAHADYLSLLGVSPIAGRDFDPSLRSELDRVVIINETSVNYFELGDDYNDVLGKEIEGRRIIGIVPDFHYNSLHQPIGPLVICWNERHALRASVRHAGHDLPGLTARLEALHREFMPGRSFMPLHLSAEFDRHYRQEERFGKIVLLFSGFAVFIACLGLFGLASFMAGQRSREIAVRKVLGAGVLRISFMMLKDFYILAGIALAVATPLAWYFMDNWLSSFPYHAGVGALPFVLGGLLAFAVTTLSVSYHAIRVSLANPSEALKYE
jgi:putative ABC transport system permease protein